MQATKARGNWYDIETAPLTGKAVRLLLKDSYGTYPFEPAGYDKKQGRWVNAKTGKPIMPEIIGWSSLKG
jgi:hypothetical protein